jgi:hypothetical protein
MLEQDRAKANQILGNKKLASYYAWGEEYYENPKKCWGDRSSKDVRF